MSKYRVTINVTLDVDAESENEALAKAVVNVRSRIGDDGITPLADRIDPIWVTGISQEPDGSYRCYKQNERKSDVGV